MCCFYCRTVTDSPTWFLKRNMPDKVKDIILDAATSPWSKAKIPKNLKSLLSEKVAEVRNVAPQQGFLSLWHDSYKSRVRYVCFYVSYACITINFFGMMLNMRNYGKFSMPLNAQTLAYFEIFGCLFALVISLYFNRRKFALSGIFNIVGGVCALTVWIYKEKGKMMSYFIIIT